MREIGRQRRLRRSATIGLAAMVAIAVGGSLAATQAKAASTTPAAQAGYGGGLSVSKQFFGQTRQSPTRARKPTSSVTRSATPAA